MAHALRSPSRAHRFMRCAGSIREESKYPEKPSGPAAIDGTHSHTLLEHCVKAGLADPTGMVGVRMKDHEGEFVVDAGRAERVKLAIDYVKERSLNGQFPVIAERRVNPAWLLGRDDMHGTVDITIRRPDETEIIDFKDGMNPVDVEGNEQLELYAIGDLSEHRLAVNVEYPYKLMRFTVIQPKLKLKRMPPIVHVNSTVKDVLALIPKYVAGAAATDDPAAPLTPGEKQCRYCAATGCSARAGLAFQSMGVDFPNLTLTPETIPIAATPAGVITNSHHHPTELFAMTTELTPSAAQQLANHDPGTMTDAQLLQIIEAAPLIRQTIAQAEDEAQRRLEAGKSVPGLKLVNGRGSRVWSLPEEQMAEKLRSMGVPKDAVYVTKIVSPAQAEKLTWTNRKNESKTLSERQLKTLETEYITKLAGKLTVALASDERPAVVRDASVLFNPVQEQPAAAAPALPDWMQTPAWMK